MLHQFTVQVPINEMEEVIEKLNIHGYYNSFYELPMGEEPAETSIALNIILEDEVEPSKVKEDLAVILKKRSKEIFYQVIENKW